MFTLVHKMEGAEYGCQFVSYSVSRQDGELTFHTFDDDEGCKPSGSWGGFEEFDEQIDDLVSCTIFVMNSSGSTIASYRYFAKRSTFCGDDKTLEQADSERLAA